MRLSAPSSSAFYPATCGGLQLADGVTNGAARVSAVVAVARPVLRIGN